MTGLPLRPAATPLYLGFLATIPFLAGAILVWSVDASSRPVVAQALSAYAAVVVAFIGAIHWGFAFAKPLGATRSFVWGVMPSLVAWASLLTRPSIGLVVQAVMLAICYLVDRATYPAANAGAWLPLRLRLTIVATLCCVAGALGV